MCYSGYCKQEGFFGECTRYDPYECVFDRADKEDEEIENEEETEDEEFIAADFIKKMRGKRNESTTKTNRD